MSQNPYSQFGAGAGGRAGAAGGGGAAHPQMGPGGPFDMGGAVEPRTSIAAIISLVSGLICCIPGLGLVGIITGIASFFLIGSSHGRVKGRGLALSGFLLGCVSTAIWLGVVIAAFWGMATVLNRSDRIATAIEQQDYTTVRSMLGPIVASVSDEQFVAFREAYHAEVGAYQSMPRGLVEYARAFEKVGPTFQQGFKPGYLPIPAEFDMGTAIIIVETPQGQSGSGPPDVRIGIRSIAGNEVWLTGPKAVSPGAQPP